ncbi:MAG: tetratricopeptide repeat protein, partial [Acidimicrobiales bacterium]
GRAGQPARSGRGSRIDQQDNRAARRAGLPWRDDRAAGRAGRVDRPEDDAAVRRFRGSVARKGARVVGEPRDERWKGDDRDRRLGPRPEEWAPEVWIEEPAEPAPAGAGHRPRSTKALPAEVHDELGDAVDRAQAVRVERRLAEATTAYERDRYEEALRTLRPVARLAPASPAVRELHGLTLYRLGRWKAAIRELEAFHALTGSFDQHPVLMDSLRATGRFEALEGVWEQLRRASPSPEVLTEGRIVLAGARADRGDLGGAIEVLAKARTKEKPPPLRHLRLWYALADLYERAGEVPRARALFRKVLDHDPTLFDTPQRLAALD